MIKVIRYEIANCFMDKAIKQVSLGKIDKALRNVTRAILIAPPSKELNDSCKELIHIIADFV